jgi:DNA segregation ATPase FtsK/SpoIIIE-like protein
MMGEQRDRAYGKGARMLLASLAACRDVVIWAIDLRRGAELRPWAPCLGRLATTPAEAAALLADAVTIMSARVQHLAGHGKRERQPSPARPALVMMIIIGEYAELAGDAPGAMSDTGTIARLGRAPAVTLVAATRRPTQKVMGHGAVRSQMNIRISFRAGEQRDVDLILGHGTLKAGWHARKLSAPGKFLISSPEHDTPRRARAYLITDDDVTATVARYAATRPPLDRVSRLAVAAGSPPPSPRPAGNPSPDRHAAGRDDSVTEEPPASDEQEDPDAILRRALSAAPAEGVPTSDLITVTGMSRRWVFCRLRQLAAEGFAIQTVRGYWRAAR